MDKNSYREICTEATVDMTKIRELMGQRWMKENC
jgi:hypothetical protein